jgi:predicted DNA-binding transcriptional regulator AlpA
MKSKKEPRYEQMQSDADAQLTSTQLPAMHPAVPQLDLHRAIRLPEVLRMTGLSRSAWYALLNPRLPTYDRHAPRPFKLGNSAGSPSAWWVWEVLAYLQSKSNASRVH